MTRCFWRVFGVFSMCFGVALHGVRADLLRFGHLARSLRRADTLAGPSGAGPGGASPGATNRASRLSQFCNGSRSHATSFMWSG